MDTTTDGKIKQDRINQLIQQQNNAAARLNNAKTNIVNGYDLKSAQLKKYIADKDAPETIPDDTTYVSPAKGTAGSGIPSDTTGQKFLDDFKPALEGIGKTTGLLAGDILTAGATGLTSIVHGLTQGLQGNQGTQGTQGGFSGLFGNTGTNQGTPGTPTQGTPGKGLIENADPNSPLGRVRDMLVGKPASPTGEKVTPNLNSPQEAADAADKAVKEGTKGTQDDVEKAKSMGQKLVDGELRLGVVDKDKVSSLGLDGKVQEDTLVDKNGGEHGGKADGTPTDKQPGTTPTNGEHHGATTPATAPADNSQTTHPSANNNMTSTPTTRPGSVPSADNGNAPTKPDSGDGIPTIDQDDSVPSTGGDSAPSHDGAPSDGEISHGNTDGQSGEQTHHSTHLSATFPAPKAPGLGDVLGGIAATHTVLPDGGTHLSGAEMMTAPQPQAAPTAPMAPSPQAPVAPGVAPSSPIAPQHMGQMPTMAPTVAPSIPVAPNPPVVSPTAPPINATTPVNPPPTTHAGPINPSPNFSSSITTTSAAMQMPNAITTQANATPIVGGILMNNANKIPKELAEFTALKPEDQESHQALSTIVSKYGRVPSVVRSAIVTYELDDHSLIDVYMTVDGVSWLPAPRELPEGVIPLHELAPYSPTMIADIGGLINLNIKAKYLRDKKGNKFKKIVRFVGTFGESPLGNPPIAFDEIKALEKYDALTDLVPYEAPMSKKGKTAQMARKIMEDVALEEHETLSYLWDKIASLRWNAEDDKAGLVDHNEYYDTWRKYLVVAANDAVTKSQPTIAASILREYECLFG